MDNKKSEYKWRSIVMGSEFPKRRIFNKAEELSKEISTEYTEVNNNFRHFVNLEKDYLQLFVNATTLIIAAFWFVSSIPTLRYMLYLTGGFLSAGILVTELRYATYFRHFFNAAIRIEKMTKASQFSDVNKYFSKPLFGIRSTNVIISFYFIFLILWVGIFIADIFGFEWFLNIVKEINTAKLAAK
jgi:hypothetical protein